MGTQERKSACSPEVSSATGFGVGGNVATETVVVKHEKSSLVLRRGVNEKLYHPYHKCVRSTATGSSITQMARRATATGDVS